MSAGNALKNPLIILEKKHLNTLPDYGLKQASRNKERGHSLSVYMKVFTVFVSAQKNKIYSRMETLSYIFETPRKEISTVETGRNPSLTKCFSGPCAVQS